MAALFLAFATTALAQSATVSPKAIVAEIDRIASERTLWPGYDSRAIPVAIFDGAHTYLLRHPHPPKEFHEQDGVWVMDGRYPGLVANNALDIAGVQTAGVMLDKPPLPSLTEQAALVLHEAFHVYQRAHHPGWIANEVDAFTYPVDNVEALAKRRLETKALLNALNSPARIATCWAKLSMEERQQRYALLGPSATGYERGTEMNEGLAQYIQSLAAGTLPKLPADDFPPDRFRQRVYATGGITAVLLDRFYPAWKQEINTNDTTSLDAMLAAAVKDAPPGCGFSSEQVNAELARARNDVAALAAAHEQAKRDFVSQAGWKVVVDAAAAPLMPEGFDPLNVTNLGHGEVLHTRMVKLGNGSGEIEVINHTSLSEAAGAHPLFNGVREVSVGAGEQPKVSVVQGEVHVEGPGVQAHFHNAVVTISGPQTVRIRVGPPAK